MSKQTRFLCLAEVREIVRFSATSLWRLERAGKFPRRVHLGANKVGWAAHEIEAWTAARLAERDALDAHK